MIRLFASDLDGTLLNALHRTDPVVLRSIARVRKAGLHFSLATGRTLRSGRQMGFAGNVCVVCANGAIVLDEGGVPIRTRSLDPAFVQELAAAFHAFYTVCQVLPSEGRPVDAAVSTARLAACDACRRVLALTLSLIGVSAPERM